MMDPASEVERILAAAERYEGKKKPVRTKAEFQALKPQLKNAWQEFVAKSRADGADAAKTKPWAPSSVVPRQNTRHAAPDMMRRGY